MVKDAFNEVPKGMEFIEITQQYVTKLFNFELHGFLKNNNKAKVGKFFYSYFQS